MHTNESIATSFATTLQDLHKSCRIVERFMAVVIGFLASSNLQLAYCMSFGSSIIVVIALSSEVRYNDVCRLLIVEMEQWPSPVGQREAEQIGAIR